MNHQQVAQISLPASVSVKETAELRVVVVGAGPVGARFTEELLRHLPDAQITWFGNEPHRPYNRIQLSSYLAGNIRAEDLDISLATTKNANLHYIAAAIHHIDTDLHTVCTINNEIYDYDKLVIAVGARAHIPHIPGTQLSGVYCFRKLADAESLYARVFSARHIVVVGGGLLGCEAARALRRHHTQVTLLQQGERLMNRQLDDEAARHLQNTIEALGVRVITRDGVRCICGDTRVTGVDTRSGAHIVCDTVLFCAGITPNVELARNAKLQVSTGIVVSDHLQTSDPDVYAIGECCEHRGKTYGLASPGFEQAAVAAHHLAGQSTVYNGSLSISRLKVVGEAVCSIGEVVGLLDRPRQRELVFRDNDNGIYRKLVVHRGKLIGALGIGPWPEMNRVQEVFISGRRLYAWQLLRFVVSGQLWRSGRGVAVANWPASTIICQCNGISLGDLSGALGNGCQTVAALQKNTRAGTVCGSCKPLLEQLCGEEGSRQQESSWQTIMTASLTTVILALLIVSVPEPTVADSVQTRGWFELIWNDKFYKQVTGFSLLALTALGLLMSLRKRMKLHRLGEFSYWRLLHIGLGMACAGMLIFHTGFHLGDNLNRWLILDFLAVLILGSADGLVVALGHKLSPAAAMRLRELWSWMHILFAWPLLALLSIHILTVYYF